jgi:hypothetical protein
MITDKIDEYLKLRKSTAIECLEYYYACIIECFGAEFLHRSTVTDTHTVTSVVVPPITYEASTSLTTILKREAHLTSGLIFLNIQSDLIEYVWNKFP